MKPISKNSGLLKLKKLREEFRKLVESKFEMNAKNCLTCEVQGDCCTDAHFVNVQITKLEAQAISSALDGLSPELQENVKTRTKIVIDEMNSQENFAESESKTYSCPLFEKGVGCLVHKTAKPLPCVNHACYERKEDLPPSRILSEFEYKTQHLNDRVYRKNWKWQTIPEWISSLVS